jgi:hypothetical protein
MVGFHAVRSAVWGLRITAGFGVHILTLAAAAPIFRHAGFAAAGKRINNESLGEFWYT